jgi:hypothetical protein
MILKSGVFLKQGAGILTASWVPMLVVVTLDKWLHLFQLENLCEKFHESSAFNSFVMDSKRGMEMDIFTPIDPLMAHLPSTINFQIVLISFLILTCLMPVFSKRVRDG